MKQARRVLGGAACAATVAGLLLPMGAAVAEAPPCDSTTITQDPTAHVYNVQTSCALTQPLQVQDGWTVDGNSLTLTIDPTFTGGAAIESTPGPSGTGGATSMTVEHLEIEAAGSDAAIRFSGATGAVHDVHITGGAGTDYGVEVDNATTPAAFGAGLVKIDRGTSIGGYQVAGIYVHGDAKFSVLKTTVRGPGAAPGPIVSGIWAADGAHGSVKESTIELSAMSSASDTTYGAGVRIVGDTNTNRRIEVKRNVFSGLHSDFGISVETASTTYKITAAVDCNLFRRTDPSTSGDTYDVGVAQWTPPGKTNVQLTDSTFQGTWLHRTGNISGTAVSAGPANAVRSASSTCVPNAPTHVAAAGGNGQSKVTWHAGTALPYAPVSEYIVRAKATGHPAISKTVPASATSTMLKGLKNGLNYTVTVTARSNGGSAAGTDRLYASKISLKAKPGRIHRGRQAVLHGKLTSMDPKAHLGKRHVAIWAKPRGHKWRQITTVRTKSDGSFALRVKPHKRTTYKAFYAGRPDLAAAHKTKVVVRR